MDWKARHSEAFAETCRDFGLNSWMQVVIKAAGVIVAVALIWTITGASEAWSTFATRIAGTLALLLIFPVLYLWTLLQLGQVVRTRARMLVIILGIAITLAGIAITAIGVMQRSASTADVDAIRKQLETATKERDDARNELVQLPKQTVPGGPSPVETQLRQQLQQAQDHIAETNKREIQRIQEAQNPQPKNPYEKGSALQRKFTKDQATNLINILDMLSDTIKGVPIQMPSRYIVPPPLTKGPPFYHRIAEDGFEKTIAAITAFRDQTKTLDAKVQTFVGEHSNFSDDLRRIVGSTHQQPVERTADMYIRGLERMQANLVPHHPTGRLDAGIIEMSLRNLATTFSDPARDFNRWHETIVSERIPAARRELESFL